jgi:hypothetical protein
MMNTTKLKEALMELQSQRNVPDVAIAGIQKVLSMLGAGSELQTSKSKTDDDGEGRRSYTSDAVAVLESVGHPLHISDLGVKISELRGSKVARASLESSLIRQISKVENARVVKTKPSAYGLPTRNSDLPSALGFPDVKAVA